MSFETVPGFTSSKLAAHKRESASCGTLEFIDVTLNDKSVAAGQPFEYQVEQLVHRLAAMIAGDLLVQVPPDAHLNRIRFRRPGWQEVQPKSGCRRTSGGRLANSSNLSRRIGDAWTR